jgi:agmatine/peptidylarginine deiminase
LTLDGGNFITNGQISILTDKVLKDNKGGREKIESIIKKSTSSRPIIVQGCPGDNVGHSDGYMAFIDEKTIGLSRYPNERAYTHDQSWLTQIEGILRFEGLEVIPFQERPSSYYIPCKCEEMRRRRCCTMTANGVYINYLRLNNTILLPEYNLPSLKETLYFNSTNELELSRRGFQVIKVNCDSIANQGGVLRCLSFVL